MSAFNSPTKNVSPMIRLCSKAVQQSNKAKVTLKDVVLGLSKFRKYRFITKSNNRQFTIGE